MSTPATVMKSELVRIPLWGRLTRAYGIILIKTTQRPDKKSIPKPISEPQLRSGDQLHQRALSAAGPLS